MFFNTILVFGITLGIRNTIAPHVPELFQSANVTGALLAVSAILLSLPFLWAVILGRRSAAEDYTSEEIARLRSLQFGLTVFRLSLGFTLVVFVLSQFAPLAATSGLVLLGSFVLLFSLSKYAEPLYTFFESRFLSNLNEKETEELSLKKRPELAPWDAIMAEVEVSASSPLVAKSLVDSELKGRFGITVALIERGDHSILAPVGHELLLPHDRLFLIGSEAELERIRPILERPTHPDSSQQIETYDLASIQLDKNSPWTGKTIRQVHIRDTIGGLVVGLERNGQRTLSPDSSLIFEANDRVWLVGEKSRIESLKREFRTAPGLSTANSFRNYP